MLMVASALLVGCATPYQKTGGFVLGGYSENKISDTVYQVKFNGNVKTSKDMVWYYWIYRCAELTKSKGYSNFMLYPDIAIPLPPPKVSLLEKGVRPASMANVDGLGDSDNYRAVRTGGAPSYIYIPGGTSTITTWSSHAYVRFVKDNEPGVFSYFRAQPILDQLKPYVESSGKEPVPTREKIISSALVNLKAYPNTAGQLPSSGGKNTLADFDGLLPPAK
ncbi:hypothetical protein GCM10010975_33440 [Comamonas phosphati]|nr:hypothetical protein GCM10010975_33440 [Comamonas phosphati]